MRSVVATGGEAKASTREAPKMPTAWGPSSLGIGKSTLQKWLSQYRQETNGQAPKVGNALTDEQRELQELRKQVKRLTMERDILKKASALLALDSLNGYR